jgi:hypothetical protein
MTIPFFTLLLTLTLKMQADLHMTAETKSDPEVKHLEIITQIHLIQLMRINNLMMKIEILTLDFQWNTTMIHLIPQKVSILVT